MVVSLALVHLQTQQTKNMATATKKRIKRRVRAEDKPKATIIKNGKKIAVYHMGVSTHHKTGYKFNRYKTVKGGTIIHQIIKKK